MFNRKYIFKGSIFHCYVRLPECIPNIQFITFDDNKDFPQQLLQVFQSQKSSSNRNKNWSSENSVSKTPTCATPNAENLSLTRQPSKTPALESTFWMKGADDI